MLQLKYGALLFGNQYTNAMLAAVLAVLCAIPISVHAATGTLTWEYPGTVPTSYNLYRKSEACSITPLVPIPGKVGSTPGGVKTMTDTITGPGVYCYELAAVVGLVESARSNRAEFIIPNAPANLKFTITITP